MITIKNTLDFLKSDEPKASIYKILPKKAEIKSKPVSMVLKKAEQIKSQSNEQIKNNIERKTKPLNKIKKQPIWL